MHKMFSLKTILTTLIGTSIASSLIGLPVQANEDNLIDKKIATETIFSQNNYEFGNPNYQSEPSDNFKNIIGITGLAIGTGIIGWHLINAYKPSLIDSIPTINNNNTSLLDRISPKLRQELLRLVHNQQTANRLLSGTLISHPDRSPNWVAEKVIYDLKRDR
ncbi:unknown protein [Stanieria sp. NIES-3757]|nr:unknown protein [Stanieria sp. NIES-3757]